MSRLVDVFARVDLFKQRQHDHTTSTTLSKILTVFVPLVLVVYIALFIADLSSRPTSASTATFVASDGNDEGSALRVRCLAPSGCWMFAEFAAQSFGSSKCARGIRECSFAPFGGELRTTLCYSFAPAEGVTFGAVENGTVAAVLSGKRSIEQSVSVTDTTGRDTRLSRVLARAVTVDSSNVFTRNVYHSFWVQAQVTAPRSSAELASAMAAACGPAAQTLPAGAFDPALATYTTLFKGAAVVFVTTLQSRALYSFTSIGGFVALVLAIFGACATGYRIVAIKLCKAGSSSDEPQRRSQKDTAKAATDAAVPMTKYAKNEDDYEYEYE